MKVAIVLGTRPEITKMSPVVRELQKRGISHFILHTGQHYDYLMDKVFFEQLHLDSDIINLDVGSGTHGAMTGTMMIKIEETFLKEKPDVVLVQGDTNTVLAASLVAVKLHIPLGHIEAGLRSYDRRMPEEYNRIAADHVADYLFPPTEKARDVLTKEGIPAERMMITGNTIVDTVQQTIDIAQKNSTILDTLTLKEKDYVLVTAHRPENVDNKELLTGIMDGLVKVGEHCNKTIVFPLHPRTKKQLETFNLLETYARNPHLKLVDPVGYLDMLMLQSHASLVITDSGGIQEESCILHVPCVVIRKTSDRAESIDVGAAVLSTCDPDTILANAQKMLKKPTTWKNPFGDGTASVNIVDFVTQAFLRLNSFRSFMFINQ